MWRLLAVLLLSLATDWYDNIVKKGLTMKSWELEPVEFQETVISHPGKTSQGGPPETIW